MLLLIADTAPWQLTAIVAVISAAGALTGGIAAYRNVSSRKQNEHEDVVCRRAKRVFETFIDGMLVVDHDLRIVWANRQARAITGYYSDLEGRYISELVPERFRALHTGHVSRFFDDPHTRRMGVSPMTLFLIDRQGREKEVKLSLTPAEDDYGGIEVTIGMAVVQ